MLPNLSTKVLSVDDCHESEITGIEVITEPFNIFTSSRDGFIRMWGLNQSNVLELTSTGIANNSIECLKMTATALVVGCSDGTVKLFQWHQMKKQWENISSVEAHTANVTSLTAVGPLLYSVGADGACNIILVTDSELSLIAKLGLDSPASTNGYFEAAKTIPVGLQDGTIAFYKKEGFIQKGFIKKSKASIKKIFASGDFYLICDIAGGLSTWTVYDAEKAADRKEKIIAQQQSAYQSGGYQQHSDSMMN